MRRPVLFLSLLVAFLFLAVVPVWAADSSNLTVAPPLQSQASAPQPDTTQQTPATAPQTQQAAPVPQAASQPAQSPTVQSQGDNIPVANTATGLPNVTTDQVVNKAQRIAMNIYGAAAGAIPYLALVVIIAGVVLSIFFKAARTLVFMAVLALVIVMFAPQIVSFVTTILRS